jgi:hypothetical protein
MQTQLLLLQALLTVWNERIYHKGVVSLFGAHGKQWQIKMKAKIIAE